MCLQVCAGGLAWRSASGRRQRPSRVLYRRRTRCGVRPPAIVPFMNPTDFTERLVIRLPHTDAAGVVFYPKVFEIEQELF